MADKEHVNRLRQSGVEAWNAWRDDNPTVCPNLSGADLSDDYLSDADLSYADLREANLRDADLLGANLTGGRLWEANLSGANLVRTVLNLASLFRANLSGANLNFANLFSANLSSANLSGATLTKTELAGTVFGDVDLTAVTGLETCEHWAPSIIDHRTLQKSGHLPLTFLRGVGLPDNLIKYLPSLLNQTIQHYSCFISYRAKGDDEEFVKRLYADLQDRGVRCWFDKHDLPIGAKTWDAIDEAIKLRDKLLVVLSKESIKSKWVEDEVQKALAEERDREPKQLILFPVRIDDAVMETQEPWARKLRDQRNVGDFRGWKDHDSYKQSLERVLRDLTVKPEVSPKVP
jgi:uncharacterized protein YjbI with pentapeptide repeats